MICSNANASEFSLLLPPCGYSHQLPPLFLLTLLSLTGRGSCYSLLHSTIYKAITEAFLLPLAYSAKTSPPSHVQLEELAARGSTLQASGWPWPWWPQIKSKLSFLGGIIIFACLIIYHCIFSFILSYSSPSHWNNSEGFLCAILDRELGSELPESQSYLHRFCTFMAEANIVKAKMIIKPILGLELLPRNKKGNGKERIMNWLNLNTTLINVNAE